MTVRNWAEIKTEFTDGLVLGNGASIAFDDRFKYKTLKDEAKNKNLISEDIESVFNFLKTDDDFELVLKMLWQANQINKALGICEPRTEEAYQSVRSALIKVIRSIHVEHDEVKDRLQLAGNFMRHFKTVASLNYDLLVYWAFMQSKHSQKKHEFKDCFINGKFDQEWEKLRVPKGTATKTTIVGYPHGNLALAADLYGNEEKISTGDDDKNLLEKIFSKWEKGKHVPVFVCEGSSPQKLSSIRRSSYLVKMHDELLASMRESVVIFGWSVSQNDEHLLDSICRGGATKYAYAIDPKSESHKDKMNDIKILIEKMKKGAEVVFFDRKSPGFWINPS